MKQILTVLVFLFSASNLLAQELVVPNYLYEPTQINPAYSGIMINPVIYGGYKSQWVGFEGAPKTVSLAYDNRFGDRTGINISLINDKIGITQSTDFTAAYSYKLDVYSYNRSYLKLNLGISATATLYDNNYSLLNLSDYEPSLSDNRAGAYPNIGVGALLYNNEWFIGLSVPRIFNRKEYDFSDESNNSVAERYSIYLTGGYKFYLNRNWDFKPILFFRKAGNFDLISELATSFIYEDREGLSFELSGSYNSNKTFGMIAALSVFKSMKIGYSYRYNFNSLNNRNLGTHDIFMRFSLSNKEYDNCSCIN